MRQKLHTTENPTFSLLLGKELVTMNETKSTIVNIYDEVGMTDWEIHLSKTMYFRDNDRKQETKKPDSPAKRVVENADLKNKRPISNYWFG